MYRGFNIPLKQIKVFFVCKGKNILYYQDNTLFFDNKEILIPIKKDFIVCDVDSFLLTDEFFSFYTKKILNFYNEKELIEDNDQNRSLIRLLKNYQNILHTFRESYKKNFEIYNKNGLFKNHINNDFNINLSDSNRKGYDSETGYLFSSSKMNENEYKSIQKWLDENRSIYLNNMETWGYGENQISIFFKPYNVSYSGGVHTLEQFNDFDLMLGIVSKIFKKN